MCTAEIEDSLYSSRWRLCGLLLLALHRDQGVLLKMLDNTYRSCCKSCMSPKGKLHQQHDDLVVVHQQAEAVLQDSEARTHAILHTAVDGIITIDDRGIVESLQPGCRAPL